MCLKLTPPAKSDSLDIEQKTTTTKVLIFPLYRTVVKTEMHR